MSYTLYTVSKSVLYTLSVLSEVVLRRTIDGANEHYFTVVGENELQGHCYQNRSETWTLEHVGRTGNEGVQREEARQEEALRAEAVRLEERAKEPPAEEPPLCPLCHRERSGLYCPHCDC